MNVYLLYNRKKDYNIIYKKDMMDMMMLWKQFDEILIYVMVFSK